LHRGFGHFAYSISSYVRSMCVDPVFDPNAAARCHWTSGTRSSDLCVRGSAQPSRNMGWV